MHCFVVVPFLIKYFKIADYMISTYVQINIQHCSHIDFKDNKELYLMDTVLYQSSQPI